MMTVKQLLDRAGSMVNQPAIYALGKGGYKPDAETPLQDRRCDCSGFVAWALGLNRHTKQDLYVRLNGGWLETTAMWRDATEFIDGILYRLPLALPGCLALVPDAGGRQGHVGIVTLAARGQASRIIDCSSSNPPGRAIQQRGADFFIRHPKTAYAWYVGVQPETGETPPASA